jgi:hypothetical protein
MQTKLLSSLCGFSFILLFAFSSFGQDVKPTQPKQPQEKTESPTKQETIDFIKSKLQNYVATYEEISSQSYEMTGLPPKRTKSVKKYQIKFLDVEVKDCILTWTLETLQLEDSNIPSSKNSPYSNKKTIDLSKINISSVRVERLIKGRLADEEKAVRAVKEEMSKSNITLTEEFSISNVWVLVLDDSLSQKKVDGQPSYYPATPNTTRTFQANFLLQDEETAKRLAKAFQHLTKLCGGKTEPF